MNLYRGWFGKNAAYYVKHGEKGDEKRGRQLKLRPRFISGGRIFHLLFHLVSNTEIEKRSRVFHRVFHRDFSRARKVILVSKINIHIKRRAKSKPTYYYIYNI